MARNELAITADAMVITPIMNRKIFLDRTWDLLNRLSITSAQNHENILRHFRNGRNLRWSLPCILTESAELIDQPIKREMRNPER